MITDGLRVQVAFEANPDAASPTWTDVTRYVRLASGISITRGRQDARSQPSVGTCAMTLDNTDGRFTSGRASSPYSPWVIPGRKLRVQWKDPNDGGASWTDRFVGHVESWPTTQGPTTAAYTSINVVDRLAALGLADELRSVPSQEILAGSNLAAYYPLNGDLGSVAEAPQESLMVRPGPEGTLDLQGGTGVPTDGGASPLFTPTSVTTGSVLDAQLSSAISIASGRSVRGSVRWAGAADERIAFALSDIYGTALEVAVSAAGAVIARARNTWTGTDEWTLTTPTNVMADGGTHSLTVTETNSGGATQTVRLYVDGIEAASTSTAPLSSSSYSFVHVGGGAPRSRAYFPGTLCHVAVWSAPLSPTQVAAHHVACTTGWAGERTDERIARVASWVGVTPAEMALDVGAVTVGHRDTSGASPVGVMQDLAVTEGGALLVDRSGRVQFDWRRHRTLQSSVLTVIGSDDNAVVSNADLRDVVNDVSVERSGGATVRKVDASSVQQFRRRRISVTTAADTDAQAIATAEYLLSRFAYPRPEIQSVSVDVHTLPSAQHAATLAADFGDKITISSLPTASLPFGTYVAYIEGYTETLGPGTWTTIYFLSSITASGTDTRPWILGDATYSVLGSTTIPAY